MTDDDTDAQVRNRRTFEAPGDSVEVRQEDESGVFELRMPIASTGEVRNANDDPLPRDAIDGMARQINDESLSVGVFLDHGQTDVGGPTRYSISERIGEWKEAEVMGASEADSDADLLMATARLMDPDSLPDIPIRGHIRTVKELAQRDMSVPSSIGWRDDDSAPGGVDLMEASIVGIAADPRTQSDADAAEVVARAAVDAGADPGELVERVQQAVRNLDDPQFSEGDKVEWTWDDTPVHGRVAGIHEQYTPPEADDPITGDEGEAVYSIHEYDDETEELSDTANVAKPESSLSPSDVDMPTLDSTNDMTDDDNAPDDGGTTDDEQTADTENAREMECQECGEMNPEDASYCMACGAELGDEQMDDGDDEEDDEEDEEQAADDPDSEQSGEVSELREEIDAMREELADLRSGGMTTEDVDTPDDQQDADDEQTDDRTAEDGAKSLIR